jgi:predicted cupin superfamily sugar epimerase
MLTAPDVIRQLNLQPHPKEGGYFRETYRAAESLPAEALAARYGAARATSTAIYYLLTPNTYSALHRLQSDEVFHFYGGSPVEMLQLFPNGAGHTVILGDLSSGGRPQVVVPRGVWQGSALRLPGEFALLGCTVAPGFDYADYENGQRETLIAQYPQFADLIRRLTPG